MKKSIGLVLFFLSLGCTHMSDKYIWLENIDSSESKAWVSSGNQHSNEYFSVNPYFASDKKDYESVILAEDRLPILTMHGDWLYEVWKDRTRQQGLMRRMKTTDFVAGKSNWEILLDLDALSVNENAKWVLKRT